ncbi:MAG: hypothetical protein IIY39_03650 [Firmicutes bacterium]|nr:hypothetical protein [Bacillota bacterium]
MPRPLGSKNKPKTKANDLDALNAQIVEKLNQKSALEQEEATLTATITESKARLKEVRLSLKKLDKNISALQVMKEEIGKAKQVEKAMGEIQAKVNALLDSGKSIDEIMEMLK